ncbi:hypothetical protein Thal_0139 [Thermocrinis albus DSM 14484]|uniref:O-antigen polymerase n=1 Tax=Thermocrinis albus (strain DSM 14484 / JCM 11386 / HI 11/12) TaxID=638303 RepID=D3SNN8_THEAH|nr:O-antigen polysaccharide polymerase Wzy [Thermocrinis albus]ADC88775.1 hypothetical protein Thal_0139 [Thermocrinis albus DSM 14484]
MRRYRYSDKILVLSFVSLFIGGNIFLINFIDIALLKYVYVCNIVFAFLLYLLVFGKKWHPVLIFMGTLTLFQGGLIISSIFDTSIDISFVFLMEANLYLQEDSLRTAMLIINLSYWFVLLGGLWGSISDNYKLKDYYNNNGFLKKLFLAIFLIALPFYIYKIFIYFFYFLQGGYMAFYQSTEYLEKAGFITRAISYFAYIGLLGYFLQEQNRKYIFTVLFIWLFMTLPVLLSGFRGQFFTFWLTIFLFYKKRFDKRLKLREIFIVFIIVSVLSLIVSYYREAGTLGFLLPKNPVLEFLKQQGVSFFVTAMAVEFSDEFSGKILKYLLWEPLGAIYSQYSSLPDRAFATDLMIKINYQGYLMGYGVGSSYLAEAYLLSGILGTCIVSFFIGFILSKLWNMFDSVNIYGKILVFVAVQGIIYLPRDLLLMPLSYVIKAGVYVLALYIMIEFIKGSPNLKLIEKGKVS